MISILAVIALLSLGSVAFIQQDKFGKSPAGEFMERIQKSPNFRDGEFQNIQPTTVRSKDVSAMDMYGEFFFKKKIRNKPIDSIPGIHIDLHSQPWQNDVLVWFGHSSYLLSLGGMRILVDPVFSDHASPVSGIVAAFPGSNRYSVDDMPVIDILVITHDHWDHLDYETIKKLKPKVKSVVCGLGVGETLELWGYESKIIHELDWEDRIALDSCLVITSHTARHFSGRSLQRNKTLWASYTIQTRGRRVFLGGDGGYGPHFAEIGKKHGPYDLAILENGQYDKAWKNIHTMPDELPLIAQDLRAQNIMTIHNSKFPLSNHSWDEPLELAYSHFQQNGLRLLTPMIGELVNLENSLQVFGPWWRKVQ